MNLSEKSYTDLRALLDTHIVMEHEKKNEKALNRIGDRRANAATRKETKKLRKQAAAAKKEAQVAKSQAKSLAGGAGLTLVALCHAMGKRTTHSMQILDTCALNILDAAALGKDLGRIAQVRN